MGYRTINAMSIYGLQVDIDILFDIIAHFANTPNSNNNFKKYNLSISSNDRKKLRNLVTEYNDNMDNDNIDECVYETYVGDDINNDPITFLNKFLHPLKMHVVCMDNKYNDKEHFTHDKTQIYDNQYFLCPLKATLINSFDIIGNGCNKITRKEISDQEKNEFISNLHKMNFGMDINDMEHILLLHSYM